MKKRGDDFKLGLTVIVMFSLLVGGLLFIGGDMWKRPIERRLVVRFAPGGTMPELVPGSLVTCLGQRVGEVEQTGLIEAPDRKTPEITDRQYLEVIARVRADLNLRTDCRVLAVAPPLGGKGSMEIVARGQADDRLDDDTAVYGETSGLAAVLDMLNKELDEQNRESLLAYIKLQLDDSRPESLIAKIHGSLDDVNRLTQSLADEVNPQRASSLIGKVHAALDEVNSMTAQLARQVDETRDEALIFKAHLVLTDIRDSLQSINEMILANRIRIDNTMTSIEHAAQVADTGVLVPLADQLDAGSPQSLINQMHSAFDRLNKSLADINVASDEARRMVVLNSGRISEVVENASEASLALKNGIKDLSLRPWRLLIKPTESQKRELQTITIAREFAESAASLDDAANRLKTLLDARGDRIPAEDPQLAVIFSDLQSAVHRFGELEQALWEELRNN